MTNSVGLMGCDLCSFSRTAVDSCYDMGFSTVSADIFALIQQLARCWDTTLSRFRSGLEEPRSGMERDVRGAAPHSAPAVVEGATSFPSRKMQISSQLTCYVIS